MSAKPAPRNIVVTGASRGLGFGFTRLWLEKGERVLALARRPDGAEPLAALARNHPERLSLIRCDVSDDLSVQQAAAEAQSLIDHLDILVNNAGMYGSRETGLDSVSFDELHQVFEVNTIGPLRVCRSFLPLLRRGSGGRIAHVTSLMGSIADNGSGGSYPYRLSKAALNMANRNLAMELEPEGILSVAIHPGWVQTDMGGAGAPLSTPESVAAMVKTIESLRPEQAGGFVDRDGNPMPW
jgi:NAD(P)-dependent dehydrogenase (short-subunit alcohol dehydrogenase family)